ncbi:motility-associated ABC transporter substrate-binding family protein [Corallococcus silvisoli]|uniref:Gldg family protein n=1 Tax=Corallococcus silvisoli TaxID=2697031 RepID=UPI0013774F20|nr:Gldg family protein [Corallococcus silvisoli]NBD08031.1 ABC transporter [Corallococcus silvisoli]
MSTPASFGTGLAATGAFVAGLVAVFIAERVLGAGSGRVALAALGVGVAVAATAWRVVRMLAAPVARRTLERWVLTLYGLGLLALALYFVRGDVGTALVGEPLSRSSPRLSGVLSVLFPALLLCALVPLAMVEAALVAMARAPVPETGRVRSALFSGLGVAFAVVFAFAATYVATEADASWDLSYFRTAKPGEATRKLVRGLNEPLQVTVFFPPANEVGEAVRQYFRDLSPESPRLGLEVLDQAVEPARGKALGVSNNGSVVLARGDRKEILTLGLDPERARGQLQRLDAEVQRRLLAVAKPRRIVYLTGGHGERADTRPVPGEAVRPSVAQLKELLRAQNVDVRTLTVAEGLGTEVPRDASLVAVLGPTHALLPEEVAALREYWERGGRLWIALEPDGAGLEPLLRPLGLRSLRVPLANDRVFFRATRQQSDRGNLGTANFSSHPSVTSLSALGSQGAVAFLGAVALEPVTPPVPGVMLDTSVRAHPETFADANGDFEPGPGEVTKAWPLVVAVERPAPEGKPASRAVVMADADAVGDGILGNVGNAYLAVDTLRWLSGEEALSGVTTSEEDVPIQHTRSQDVAWFYATVFGVPVAVLAVGFFVTRRRGRRAPRSAAVAGGAR